MDIQLEKKKGLQKKHIPYVAGGVLFVILLDGLSLVIMLLR